MSAIQQLLTDHIDIWTAAETEKRSGRGRASGNAGSVYGIKKLRELILELAVRGKLVPQDANDEPACELLKGIQAKKAKLIAEGKIKKDKPLAAITEDEKPFELPKGWEWVRVGQVGHDWGQKEPDSNFTYIEVSAIDSTRGVVSSPGLVAPEDAPSRARKIVKKGTVIYSTVRPYLLNIAVIEEEFSPEPIASTAFAIVHPFCLMPPRYFLSFFRSPVFVRYVESVQMGIAYPAINDGQFFSGLIPLPPIEEQHRIVAKVDELMALCDQLENQHSNAAEAHEKLVSHLLGTLTQSQNAEDFSANWQRIAAHFDTLFATDASIDALKQTLLQLAVMGKLVPQNANDEPASELLKRIQAEKAKLISEGKIKKDKPLTPITDVEKPFELPLRWEWVRLSDIATQITDGAHHTPEYISDGVPFLSVKNLSSGCLDFTDTRFISPVAHADLTKRCNPEFDDILLTKIGTTGIAVVIDDPRPFSIFVSVALIKLPKILIDRDYLSLVINSPFVRQQSEDGTEGVGNKNLVLRKINTFDIPFAPLAEQHRIVAKVDELMALCDQLKSRITDASRLQQKLADVLVEQAVA
ncbi:restriction modification system DNA specificity domain [Gallionella capsiferriformans ES-2]|uniref:Restriction modification system DNA specificity domain n=1 Tax=Gallionella capsiferriformans (strain ES-2) TaxID=395494 RepID=D9SJS3_GALCS|nr:restriction modification system DNA specificity domain [Gallionella capsiferriformans ES-2]